ncbi:hypothetical protein L7F22_018069 [Adiantum nelumboides]|nr:hypothetical protein [Adiantum nelumboides]
MDEMYKKAKVALEKTQAKQKKAPDHHRREVVFLLGDWVLLCFEKARPYVGDVPEDMVAEEQPEVEELDEILVPEQVLAHKERKVEGKVARRYWVKFRKYPPMDAKWMEEDVFWLRLQAAVEKKLSPEDAAQFCDFFRQVHDCFVHAALNSKTIHTALKTYQQR